MIETESKCRLVSTAILHNFTVVLILFGGTVASAQDIITAPPEPLSPTDSKQCDQFHKKARDYVSALWQRHRQCMDNVTHPTKYGDAGSCCHRIYGSWNGKGFLHGCAYPMDCAGTAGEHYCASDNAHEGYMRCMARVRAYRERQDKINLAEKTIQKGDGKTTVHELKVDPMDGGLGGTVWSRTTTEFLTDEAAQAESDQIAHNDNVMTVATCIALSAATGAAGFPAVGAAAGTACSIINWDNRERLRKGDYLVDEIDSAVAGGAGGTSKEFKLAFGIRDNKPKILWITYPHGEKENAMTWATEEINRLSVGENVPDQKSEEASPD